MEKRKIINDIKKLINAKGYIYALCMILFEDFHIHPETMQETDWTKRISHKEASFLLGFLIQNKIDLSIPETPNDLILFKQKTYDLMKQLHDTFLASFQQKLQKASEKKYHKENIRKEEKKFFSNADILQEAIFYSGTDVYDFQYLDSLEKKYKYEKSGF